MRWIQVSDDQWVNLDKVTDITEGDGVCFLHFAFEVDAEDMEPPGRERFTIVADEDHSARILHQIRNGLPPFGSGQ